MDLDGLDKIPVRLVTPGEMTPAALVDRLGQYHLLVMITRSRQ